MTIYDAIIVGARVAGSVTAIALARRGHRVLLLDRARFPSDTLSTHSFGRETTLRFGELGVLDEIEAAGAPPIRRMRMVAPDEGVEFSGRYAPYSGIDAGYCLRRVVLDEILIRAARAAGAEVREGATVIDLLREDGQVGGVAIQAGDGKPYAEAGQVVIGADGRHSRVARIVGAQGYASAPALAPTYYAYFGGVTGPRDAIEVLHTAKRDYFLFPADGDLTCVAISLPEEDQGSYRIAHERQFVADLRAVPELADRFAGARQQGSLKGAADLESYMRVPYGSGWLLAGDAGVHIHPVTARGISLAVRDGMLLAEALGDALDGRRDPGEALAEYHALRDAESGPAYAQALGAAMRVGKPLPPPLLALWRALAALPDEADAYASRGGISSEEAQRVIARADLAPV